MVNEIFFDIINLSTVGGKVLFSTYNHSPSFWEAISGVVPTPVQVKRAEEGSVGTFVVLTLDGQELFSLVKNDIFADLDHHKNRLGLVRLVSSATEAVVVEFAEIPSF